MAQTQATKQFIWDGQKSIDLDQYPAQAWTDLGGQTSDTSNDSRADRVAVQTFYETVSVLYRCVKLRQVGVGRIPWAITRNGQDVWVDTESQPPAQLAYLKDFRRLLRLTEAALCLSPEAFWFVERNRVKPLALRWHSPSSVIPQWSSETGLTGYKRILGQGHYKMLEPQDYVCFSLPNPFHETIPGRPPAQASLAAAGVLYNVDGFASKFFARGAIKATLLTAPIGTSIVERDRLKAWWRRAFSGLGNAFSTEVVSTEVKPIVVGEGLEQLNNGELTRAKQEEIATAMGVPHSLVFSNAATFATAQQDDLHFYDKTIIPAFEFIAEVINEQLLEKQGYSLQSRPESMSIYQADEHERSASLQSLVAAGTELDLAMEILGFDLTEEQWARVRTPKPEPVAPVVVAPVTEVPVAVEPAGIPDTPDRTAEVALLKRWARKRKNPDPSDFSSRLLSDAEKAAIVSEVSSGTDFFGLTGGRSTHKATGNPPDPEEELRKREAAERKAEDEIAAGLEKQQAAVVTAIGKDGNISAVEQAITESHTTATEALRRALISGTDLGVSFAIAGLESVGFGMDWTLANTDARDWAGKYAGQLIKDIDATSLDNVRRAVGAWTESGAPLETLVEQLTTTFGRNRASLIASTEITRSYAEGQRIAYKASGVVTSWEWQTNNDEIVCPVCGPLNGKTVKIDNPFNVHLPAGMKVEAFDAPPAHPRCRCFLTPTIDDIPAQGAGAGQAEAVAPSRALMTPTNVDVDVNRAQLWYGRTASRRTTPFGPIQAIQQKKEIAQHISQGMGVSMDEANRFVKNWADTSNDEFLPSLKIQEIASRKFGLQLSDWQKGKIKDRMDERLLFESLNKPLADNVKFPFEIAGRTKEEMERLTESALQIIYDRTQEELQKAGIENTILYRGVVLEKKLKKGVDISIEGNALESWTTNYDIAKSFGGGKGGNILATIVPRERIFSTSRTGFGCLEEWEFITMGIDAGDIVRVVK